MERFLGFLSVLGKSHDRYKSCDVRVKERKKEPNEVQPFFLNV